MSSVNIPPVTTSLLALPRRPLQPRAVQAAHADRDRGRAAGGTQGRAWINGREVGGTEPRLAHLGGGHD
jgi:hypothetical protein